MKQNFDEIVTKNDEFFLPLQELEESLFYWAQHKLGLHKQFAQTQGEYMYRMEDFPESWHNFMISSYFVSKVIFDQQTFKKYVKSESENLSPAAERMLKTWKKEKPVWSAFTAEKTEDSEFFYITDIFTGDKRLLYSKGVNEELKKPGDRNTVFICALLHNGECWSTYGIVRRYIGLTQNDFHFLVNFMERKLFLSKGLNSIINKFYARFFQIDRFMNLPLQYNGKILLEECWSELELEDFEPEVYFDVMDVINQYENCIHLSLKQKAANVPGAELFYDKTNNNALLTANTREDFANLASELNREYELDTAPDNIISINLYSIMTGSMDYNLPLVHWGSLFPADEVDSTEAADELMAGMNRILKEKLDADNTGREYDIDKRAEELGLDAEISGQIEGLLKQIEDKYSVPGIKGGVEYQVPPPVLRTRFTDSLRDSSIFDLETGPATYREFRKETESYFPDKLYLEIQEYIESSFIDEFEEYGRTVMNSFFYIFCQKQDEFVKVKDYAAETLKLFGHVILSNLELSIQSFTEIFSYIISDDLSDAGLITLQTEPSESALERGNYKIKPSAFYKKLISLKS